MCIRDRWKAIGAFDQSLGGFYNQHLGKTMFEKVRENIDVFQPFFLRKGIDLQAELDRRFNQEGTMIYQTTSFLSESADMFDF